MTKLIWVGIRESDIDFTGDLFDFSITYYGKCTGNNVSYYNGGYHKKCTKKEFVIKQLQNIGLTPDHKVLFYNPSMAYSVLDDFPELSTHLVGLCSANILDILNDKIQTRIWMSKHVKTPNFLTLHKKECSFNILKDMFNSPKGFIIQEKISSSGTGTYLMTSKNETEILQKLEENNQYLVSEFISPSASVNSHIFITNEDIIVFPGSLQLISQRNNNFIYSGADFLAYRNIDSSYIHAVYYYSRKIGDLLKNAGFRGVCGIDFVVSDGEVYFIEINPRFQASTVLLNLALEKAELPSIHHLQLGDYDSNKVDKDSLERIQVDYSYYKYANGLYDSIEKYNHHFELFKKSEETFKILLDGYDMQNTYKNQYAFGDNETLNFIVGNGIKIIGYYGVSFNPNLMRVEFPNCEEIMPAGFYGASMIGAKFPKVKKVGAEAFYNVAKLRELYLPECEEIGCYAFNISSFLKIVYAPKANFMEEQEYFEGIFSPENPASTELMFSECRSLAKVDLPLLETIGTEFFDCSPIKTVELSDVKYIYDLPNTLTSNSTDKIETFYGPYYWPVPVELSLPSTLQYCVSAEEYKNEYIQYAVYGTKGTYAEQWAIDNGIPFHEITQENAVVEDIEPVWDEYSYKPLEFDARGFNRTYQWYGSYDNTVGNDKLISGATSKTFNPNENKQYPYYYCVMNSKDIDVNGNIVNEVNITSDMCQNRLYYIFNITGTNIDYNNFRVFTQNYAQTSIDNIIGIQDTTTYYYRPSYIYRKVQYYGTGSVFEVLNGNGAWETYTLIVEGDVNGDSVVDVLDIHTVSLVANGLATLKNEYFIAGDTNLNEEITVEDYSTVVNLALSS